MAANSMIVTIYKAAKRNPKYEIRMGKNYLIVNGVYYTTRTLNILPEDINPAQLSQIETSDIIAFGTSLSRYNFLSNFYKTTIKHKNYTYNCAEQFYQHMKCILFEDKQTAEKVMKSSNPAVQKLLGKKVTSFSKYTWDNIKSDVMFDVVYAKFLQNWQLKKMLLATGRKSIMECKQDRYWGTGIDLHQILTTDQSNYGKNTLGKILEKVRAKLSTVTDEKHG